MPDVITKADHFTAPLLDKVGEGARILGALRDGGVNLIALWAYPMGKGRARMEFVPEDSAILRTAARKARLKLEKKQTVFLVNGDDRPGAVAETLARIAAAGINIQAVQAVCSGAGRYGAAIFVEAKDVRKASKALGVG